MGLCAFEEKVVKQSENLFQLYEAGISLFMLGFDSKMKEEEFRNLYKVLNMMSRLY